jgi:subtilisin family serine protease
MPPDLTATDVHPDLPRYVDHFFTELLAAVASSAPRGFDDLVNLKILAGVYLAAAPNSTATQFGTAVPREHALRVAKAPLTRSGPHSFATTGITLADGQYTEQDVVYLQDLGDAVVDDEPTLARILQNVEDGAAWATAIAGAADRAATFGKAVNAIEAAPPGAPSSDVNALRALLLRHFTYDRDGNHYAKWAGAGRTFPADVSDVYRTQAMREATLLAGEVYCLGVVPARLYDPEAPEAAMREFLVHIDRTESTDDAALEALTLDPIFSVARADRPADQPSFHHFVFFHAFEGQGVLIPESAATTLVPRLAGFLSDVRTVQQAQTYVQTTPQPAYFFEGEGTDLRIQLVGTVQPRAALTGLPPGVEVRDIAGGNRTDAEGPAFETDTRFFVAPLGSVVALAAHPDIVELHEVPAIRPLVSQANTDLNTAGLRGKIAGPIFQGDGSGVLVGVIDTGIDGTHPAFTGRIHAVWDQTLRPTANAPTFPGGNFGRVLRGADIGTTSVDTAGHGTHVAGIAAGAASPPAYTESGIASKADILMVRLNNFTAADMTAAVRWIFQEATALGRPCVINISLGEHDHDHDGTDPISRAIAGQLRDAAGNLRQGRIIVAAAGNERGVGLHVHTDHLAVPTRTADEIAHPATFRRENHLEATAVFEIFVRRGTIGEFEFPFFGVPTDPAVNRCNLAIRVELASGAGGWPGWRTQQPNANFLAHNIANTRVRISNGRAAPLGIRQSRPVVQLRSRQAGRPMDAGVWRVLIFNDGPGEAEVHGYSPSSDLRFGAHQVFFRHGTERAMIARPACADGVISVGSTVNRTSWARSDGNVVANESQTLDDTGAVTGSAPEVKPGLSSFSNSGPVRRVGRPLASMAPGGGVFSAKSAQILGVSQNDLINQHTLVLSGTSMASPVVTGLAACLLERFSDMTAADFQARIAAASALPAGGSAEDFGPGVIDASKLI